MNKNQLTKKIRETAILRFEIIAEQDGLIGIKKAKFINAEITRINDEISMMNNEELLKYLDHQSFKLKKYITRDESFNECKSKYPEDYYTFRY